MTNISEPKFFGCSSCLFFRSRQCRTCDSGEFFEERDDEIDLENRNPRNADLKRLDPNQLERVSGAHDE